MVEEDCVFEGQLLGTADSHLVRLEESGFCFLSPLLSWMLFDDFELREGFDVFSISFGLESTEIKRRRKKRNNFNCDLF